METDVPSTLPLYSGASAPTASRWDGLRVLLAEDSATARMWLRYVFSSIIDGIQIEEAEDGRTALKVLTASRVDLVVTDLQMPGMDGNSLIHVLRRNAVLRRKPILVVTGAAESFGADLGQDPFLRVLSKPPRPEQIIQAVEELLPSY